MEVKVQAHNSSQTSFLLGASCLKLGLRTDQGSMKGDPSPRHWASCRGIGSAGCSMDEGQPYSEPTAHTIFQRSPVLLTL